ncbi:hypothetical protein NW762_000396 [Fusarium torreyae]|uniref:Uncharacterized protein n=1 Tax=Fusarium torreyae TaxID=1237075 RepID=A0A9W8SHT3_9HYPO|nr:hypothetical protein NW762_000396 [Fusarium torreyae]
MAPLPTPLIARCASCSEVNVNAASTDELEKWRLATLICALVLALFAVIAIILAIQLCRKSYLVRNAQKYQEKASRYKNAYRTAETQAVEHQVRADSLTSEITRLRDVNAKWEDSYYELFGDLSDNPLNYHPQTNPTGRIPPGAARRKTRPPETSLSSGIPQGTEFRHGRSNNPTAYLPQHNGSQITRSTTRSSRPRRPDSPRPSTAPLRPPATRLSSGILRGTEFEHGGIDDGYFGPDNQDFTPLNLHELADGAAANYVVDGKYLQPPRVPIPQESRPPVRFEEPVSPVVSPHQTRLSSYWAPCRGP